MIHILIFCDIIVCVRGFLSDKRREFVARSAMDMFKLLLPAAIVSGWFFKPVSWVVKVSGGAGLMVLFIWSIWLFPKGD